MGRTIRKVNPGAVLEAPKPKRVAAYARVSSGKNAPLHSLSAQVSRYSELIQKTPGWVYVGVYADEALSGTKDSRAEFQRLLTACREKEVDLVLTKSVSRFARNVVTTLKTVRELRLIGVDVYFEKEYIQSRLYLAQPLNIACFLLITYHILWFCAIINQDLVSLVACLSLKSIK